MSEATSHQANEQTKSSRRRWLTGLTVGSLLAGLAAWGAHGWAHGERGFCRMGWPGHGYGMFHGPGALEERMSCIVERVFERAGAGEEQKARALEIIRVAAADMKPLREARRQGREAVLEILAADTIDRARLEQERVKMLTDAEEASERMTQAFADLAEVLTPAQRKTVAESLRRLRDVREEWMKRT